MAMRIKQAPNISRISRAGGGGLIDVDAGGVSVGAPARAKPKVTAIARPAKARSKFKLAPAQGMVPAESLARGGSDAMNRIARAKRKVASTNPEEKAKRQAASSTLDPNRKQPGKRKRYTG